MSTDTRIESLETQVRTLKRMLFGVFGVVIVGGLLAATSMQSVPDVIQAKQFQVVNAEGTVVASFYANMGGGMLSFSNKDGEVVVGLGSDEVNGGGVLGINNKDGKPVASIYADADGGVLGISNKDGKGVVAIGVIAGGGVLGISNKDGKEVAGIGVIAGGDGKMMTRDSKGQVTSMTP
jgi:hypothetical protein